MMEYHIEVVVNIQAWIDIHTSVWWWLVAMLCNTSLQTSIAWAHGWSCHAHACSHANGESLLSQAYLYAILDVLAKVGWGGFIVYNNDMLYTSYSKG